MDEAKKWYFNMATGQAELGPISPMEHRMGPYPTREAALEALRTVKERNLAWEETDRRWRTWDADDAEDTNPNDSKA